MRAYYLFRYNESPVGPGGLINKKAALSEERPVVTK